MNSNLTVVMRSAIEYARNHDNKITRRPGGFWACPEWSNPRELSFGASTIQALVDRGLAEFTRWQERKNGGAPFPIEMTLRGK